MAVKWYLRTSVTHGCDTMTLKYNHLERRNHTFYFRYRVPSWVRHIFEKECIRYSLNTNDYNIAIHLVKRESFKYDTLLNDIRWLVMEIRNGKLHLSQDDIENIIAQRIKEIQDKLDESYYKIKNGEIAPHNLPITMLEEKDYKSTPFDGSYEEFKDEQVISFVKKYVMAMKNNKRIPPSVFDFLKRTVKKNAIEPDETRPDWLDKLENGMQMADDYAHNRAEAIVTDNRNFYIPAVIERCLSYIEEERAANTVRAPQVKTHWQTLFKKFKEYKQQIKGTGDLTLQKDYTCLEAIFDLIDKKYVENLTAKDCDFISQKIYYIPKNWKKTDLYKKKKLKNCLTEDITEKNISTTTVKKYLRSFKEFLTYAQRKGYVSLALNVQLEIPSRETRESYDPFTKAELKKIFNPETYPYRQDEQFAFRYFIPLMALFSGARLNELCQLYLDDIKKEGKIYYMLFTDERKDQHIKNKSSKRIVPIHPKVMEMGFEEYYMSVRAKRKDRLFYQLSYSDANHYTDKMSKWFGRYLDELGIKSKRKVFHSFRHLVKPELRDAGIPQEYQNAICGWEGQDTGERTYGSNFKINVLYNELCKLKFPFLDENLKKIRERQITPRLALQYRLYPNVDRTLDFAKKKKEI